jgi:hypothetical protein
MLHPWTADLLLSHLGAQLQVFLVVYPIDELVVYDSAFATQEHVQTPVRSSVCDL